MRAVDFQRKGSARYHSLCGLSHVEKDLKIEATAKKRNISALEWDRDFAASARLVFLSADAFGEFDLADQRSRGRKWIRSDGQRGEFQQQLRGGVEWHGARDGVCQRQSAYGDGQCLERRDPGYRIGLRVQPCGLDRGCGNSHNNDEQQRLRLPGIKLSFVHGEPLVRARMPARN